MELKRTLGEFGEDRNEKGGKLRAAPLIAFMCSRSMRQIVTTSAAPRWSPQGEVYWQPGFQPSERVVIQRCVLCLLIPAQLSVSVLCTLQSLISLSVGR